MQDTRLKISLKAEMLMELNIQVTVNKQNKEVSCKKQNSNA